MISTRRVWSARRAWVVVVLGSTTVAMLWVSATTAGARVLDRERYSYSTVDHEVACGRRLRVETPFSGFRVNRSAQHGSAATFFDNDNIHEVLTDAAGEGYIIDLHGRYHDVQRERSSARSTWAGLGAQRPKSGYRRMTTDVPIGMSINVAISGLNTRTQPFETFWPAVFGSDVPWIAILPPPGQSVITFENPDSPSAKLPYGPWVSRYPTRAHTKK
jgi:hypothetical protein